MYENLTKAKSNFDSNQIFFKFWFCVCVYVYIYILPRFNYIGFLVFYTELTHFAQKFKEFRLARKHGAKLNSNWNPIFTWN